VHQKTSCVSLDRKGENVASDKESRDNPWFDDREVVSINKTDDACEDHVNCRSEKRRRNKDEGGLSDIRPQFSSPVYSERPAAISDDFHCELTS